MTALSIILSPVLLSSYFLILNADNCPCMLLGVCNNLFLKLFLFNKILLWDPVNKEGTNYLDFSAYLRNIIEMANIKLNS